MHDERPKLDLPPWDDADAILADSIFGTADRSQVAAMLAAFVDRHAGLAFDSFVDLEMSVGAGATVRLTDGSLRFVKAWPGTVDCDALAAQLHVQAMLSRQGFPAPDVLSGPTRFGASVMVLMSHNRRGVPTDVRIPGVRTAMARALARLVREARSFRDLPQLPRQKLPEQVWPKPHNALFDFTATSAGAEWIDTIAAQALADMRRAEAPLVVGHHDWSAKNMRMGHDDISVVYDWDAIFVDRETFFLGTAAAHFPVTWELPVPPTPTPDESAAFIRDYESARGKPFTDRERVEIASSMTYARAYKARCEHAGDPQRRHWPGSSREALERLGPYAAAQLR